MKQNRANTWTRGQVSVNHACTNSEHFLRAPYGGPLNSPNKQNTILTCSKLALHPPSKYKSSLSRIKKLLYFHQTVLWSIKKLGSLLAFMWRVSLVVAPRRCESFQSAWWCEFFAVRKRPGGSSRRRRPQPFCPLETLPTAADLILDPCAGVAQGSRATETSETIFLGVKKKYSHKQKILIQKGAVNKIVQSCVNLNTKIIPEFLLS